MFDVKDYFENLSSVDQARKLFPVTDSCIYLDSAHYSQFSLETRRRLTEFIDSYTFQNTNLSLENYRIADSLRGKCAELIGADKKDMIITSNTTHGLNIFANGIHLNKEDTVAFADCEFPAVVYPWLNQEKLRGIKTLMIPSKNWRIETEDIEDVIKKNNVKVLTISSVEFLGFRNDLKKVSEICMENNCYLVVDAIQSIGAVPMNVNDIKIDFLSAGSQKWMMAPAGVGFAYISNQMKDKVDPTYAGTTSVDYDFKKFLDYKLNFKKDAGAYENSTLNILGMIGLECSIDLFLKLGVKNIFEHIRNLLNVLVEKLNGSRYQIHSDLCEKHRSNILIFSHEKNSKNDEIQRKLASENIFIALREGFLRVSPHLFNSEEEIEKLYNRLIEIS